MGPEVDRSGLEVLERSECFDLLPHRGVGRIAVTSGALPNVLAVSYSLDGERILVRAGLDGPLGSALRDTVVAFEVGDVDPVELTGWSVMVTGIAHAVGPTSCSAATELPADRWTTGGPEQLVAISTEIVTGRRVPGTPPS